MKIRRFLGRRRFRRGGILPDQPYLRGVEILPRSEHEAGGYVPLLGLPSSRVEAVLPLDDRGLAVLGEAIDALDYREWWERGC